MTNRAFLLTMVVGAAGCDQLNDLIGREEKVCTLIGCSDSFNATITPRAGLFSAGTHEVIITADGSPTRTCTFEFPIEGSIESAQCTGGGGVSLLVSPMQECRTMNQGDSVALICTPIPGRFREQLSVQGLPANVRVTQRLAGGPTYLERQATPSYQDVYPNGKDCGAVCKQAAADWDF
jgi:hypothetical protein